MSLDFIKKVGGYFRKEQVGRYGAKVGRYGA